MRGSARIPTWWAVAMVLLLAGVACLIMWSAWSSPGPSNGAAPETEPRSPASTSAGTGRHEPAAAPAPARPVALTIPAIAVRSTLEGLAMNGDGTVEVPQHPGNAGWYRLGTRPGAQGSAVILGHVDSVRGPAVFYRLATLHRGNLVNVRLADGSSVRFRVRSVRLYPNARFPAEKVYAARGGRFLNLVTCGGEYDASRGGYQANVVVNARWVSTSAS